MKGLRGDCGSGSDGGGCESVNALRMNMDFCCATWQIAWRENDMDTFLDFKVHVGFSYR